jgi:glycosyltransferase involved in cell wall biosynthesis
MLIDGERRARISAPRGAGEPARSHADVSVVIPVYNHESYVGPAIRSVLEQTVPVSEIVCIDDGSSDGSADVVARLASHFPLIRHWSRPNAGAAHTLNEAIATARGTTIAILNSDDLFHPTRIARCLAVLNADPSVGVVCSEVRSIDAQGAPVANAWYEGALAYQREIGDLGLALANGNFLVSTSNIVGRRSALDAIGPFDDLRYAHDLDFFLRAVVTGVRIVLLPRPLLDYRLHAANTIGESHRAVRVEWGAALACFARRMAARRELPDGYLDALLSIAERHQLTRIVTRALLALQGFADGAVTSPARLLAEPALRRALLEEA